MLVHRLRRWPNIKPTLSQRPIFMGIYLIFINLMFVLFCVRCRRSGVGIPQLVLGRPSWGTRPHGLYSSIQLPWGMTNLVHNSLPLKARVDGKYDGLQRQHISLALRRSTAEPTGNVFMNAYKIPVSIETSQSSHQTRGIHPMLIQCWASVEDGGPTLKQHWVNAPCLLGPTIKKFLYNPWRRKGFVNSKSL